MIVYIGIYYYLRQMLILIKTIEIKLLKVILIELFLFNEKTTILINY